jgi:hypothetical protein
MARQVEWAKEEARAKTMDMDALAYTANDCREAELAMRGWNPDAEGYYSDLASVYSMEIRRRKGLR